MTPTTNQRRDYRRFNPAYFDLVDRLAAWLDARPQPPPIRLGPFDRKTAHSSKTDLYRFRTFLSNAPDDDEYARRLYDVFNEFVIQTEPSDVLNAWYLTFRLNPIAEALRTKPLAPSS